ncbi:MAG: hypothetical protein E7314_00280 [Clostridiales bacterium]|nr:hypothetical protein [Clostridiales bacterium]
MDNFFRVVKEKTEISTVLEILNERVITPISDVTILSTSDKGVTVEVNGYNSVLKIGEQYYIWDPDKKELVVQC